MLIPTDMDLWDQDHVGNPPTPGRTRAPSGLTTLQRERLHRHHPRGLLDPLFRRGSGFGGTIPKKKTNKATTVHKGKGNTSGGKGKEKRAVRLNSVLNHILKVWVDEKRCLSSTRINSMTPLTGISLVEIPLMERTY